MKIIKSNGSEMTFSRSNIINAISKANMRVRLEDRFTQDEIKQIAREVEDRCKGEIRMMTSNDIQNLVERAIMAAGKYDVAVAYITYRYQKQLDQMKDIVLEFTEIDDATYEEHRRDDWWMTAEEAMELGVVDEIAEGFVL